MSVNSYPAEEKENIAASDEEIRLVLIGKTGTGKSATGNNILGRKEFKTSSLRTSVTKKCDQQTTTISGKKVVVVDTPGLFDTDTEDKLTMEEIKTLYNLPSTRPHVFILVSKIKRFCEEDQKAFEQFSEVFGENVINFLIVVFTGADELNNETENFNDFKKDLPARQVEFLNKCGNRCLAFNNTLDQNDEDRQCLIKMVEDLMKGNQGESYNSEHFYYEKKPPIAKFWDFLKNLWDTLFGNL